MTAAEIEALVLFVAANPMAGVVIPGTGGCRKPRVAGRGKGKSGGYRAITFYTGAEVPVLLLSVFAKGERADLSAEQRAALAAQTKAIAAEYRSRIARPRT